MLVEEFGGVRGYLYPIPVHGKGHQLTRYLWVERGISLVRTASHIAEQGAPGTVL